MHLIYLVSTCDLLISIMSKIFFFFSGGGGESQKLCPRQKSIRLNSNNKPNHGFTIDFKLVNFISLIIDLPRFMEISRLLPDAVTGNDTFFAVHPGIEST